MFTVFISQSYNSVFYKISCRIAKRASVKRRYYGIFEYTHIINSVNKAILAFYRRNNCAFIQRQIIKRGFIFHYSSPISTFCNILFQVYIYVNCFTLPSRKYGV